MTRPTTRALARTVPVAVLVGVLSAVSLVVLSALAERLQHVVWTQVPLTLGVRDDDGLAWWWTVAVLTLTGLLVGAVVRWAPGHAGRDPATTGLVGPTQPLRALPGVALALGLGLAGGVSLGPENPIIVINVAVAVWIGARRPGTAASSETHAVALATAGTIGALFATPVAAALLMTAILAERGLDGAKLFDRLFSPLVAAGAGAITARLVGVPGFSVDLPAHTPVPWDLVTAPLVAVAAALLVAAGALALPVVHRFFHRLPGPVLALGAGGLALGLLGAAGGELTLFKGLEEIKELTATAEGRSWTSLLVLAVVKVAALLVAASAGFRGGRIFPAVFVGVALGLAVTALVPQVPAGVAVGAATMGAVIAVDRDGWIALFLAAVIVGDYGLLPLLCLALAPLWLVARHLPEFSTVPLHPDGPEFGRRPR